MLSGTDTEEGSDYVKGLFVASVVIAIFILTWFLLLGTLACLGPKRVGLLSGRLLTLPSISNHSDHNNDDGNHLTPANVYDNNDKNSAAAKAVVSSAKRQRRALKYLRCTVLFCSLGIFICCIIMITKGIQSLVHSQENAVEGIRKGQELADEAVVLIDTFVRLANDTGTQSRKMATQLNTNFCPAVREELCPNLAKYLDNPYAEGAIEQAGTDVQTLEEICNFEGIPYADKVESIINAGTGKLIPDSLIRTREDIVEISEMLGNMEENSGECSVGMNICAHYSVLDSH